MLLLSVTLKRRLPFALGEEMTTFLGLAELVLSATAATLGGVEVVTLRDTMRWSDVLALAESADFGEIIRPERHVLEQLFDVRSRNGDLEV